LYVNGFDAPKSKTISNYPQIVVKRTHRIRFCRQITVSEKRYSISS